MNFWIKAFMGCITVCHIPLNVYDFFILCCHIKKYDNLFFHYLQALCIKDIRKENIAGVRSKHSKIYQKTRVCMNEHLYKNNFCFFSLPT